MMRKFLQGFQLSRLTWPNVTTDSLLHLLKPADQRGTLSAMGTDLQQQAATALSLENCLPISLYTFLEAQDNSQTFALGHSDTFVLTVEEFNKLQTLLASMFPNEEITLLRNASNIRSVVYLNEFFKVDNNDRVNCNIIRARWLKAGYPLSVDPTERLARARIIQRIIVVVILVRGVRPQMLLAGVGWYSMHDETYAYGHHMHVYHKSLCNPGYYSLLPLQRIVSKCALHARKHQHIVVNLVIPLAGEWAL